MGNVPSLREISEKLEVGDPSALFHATQSVHATAEAHLESGPTLGDLVEKSTPEERDIMDLVVGAALDDEDISFDENIQADYDLLSQDQKYFVDFIVGAQMMLDSMTDEQRAEANDLAQADEVEEFLAHHGVKGMRWGVRKDTNGNVLSTKLSKSPDNIHANRKLAREAVKAGMGTLEQAHQAALKSKGHRAINAILGDKRYWRNAAIILGATAATVGLAFAAPAVLPTGVLASLGSYIGGTSGVGGVVAAKGGLTTTAVIGAEAARNIGIGVAVAGNRVAGLGNAVTNIRRAVTGNSRINRSYQAIGAQATANQRAGSRQVQKTLNREGGIRMKALKQSELNPEVEDFLAHHGVKGMRWGVRRPDGPDGTVTGGVSDGKKGASSVNADGSLNNSRQVKVTKNDDGSYSFDDKKLNKAGVNETRIAKLSDDGAVTTIQKRADGNWHEVRISADAERFIKTTEKESHEMSTREIKEALERARQVTEYNKILGMDDPNAGLKQKVEALDLQKRYGALNAELNPSMIARATSFVKAASPAFGAFKALDELSGGVISSEIKSSFQTLAKSANEPATPKTPKAKKTPKEGFEDTKYSSNPFKKKRYAGTRTPDPTPTSSRPSASAAAPSSRPTPTYNVTNLGTQQAFPDPTIPQLGSGR